MITAIAHSVIGLLVLLGIETVDWWRNRGNEAEYRMYQELVSALARVVTGIKNEE